MPDMPDYASKLHQGESGFTPKPKPIFKTFVNDLFAHVETHQEGEMCAKFELRLADCVEAYGFPKCEEKCVAFLRDLRECLIGPKQMRRTFLMRNERERQFNAGERKVQFEPSPRIDSY